MIGGQAAQHGAVQFAVECALLRRACCKQQRRKGRRAVDAFHLLNKVAGSERSREAIEHELREKGRKRGERGKKGGG